MDFKVIGRQNTMYPIKTLAMESRLEYEVLIQLRITELHNFLSVIDVKLDELGIVVEYMNRLSSNKEYKEIA
jgi:hypothetical protein